MTFDTGWEAVSSSGGFTCWQELGPELRRPRFHHGPAPCQCCDLDLGLSHSTCETGRTASQQVASGTKVMYSVYSRGEPRASEYSGKVWPLLLRL